jgi:hypothetical protein
MTRISPACARPQLIRLHAVASIRLFAPTEIGCELPTLTAEAEIVSRTWWQSSAFGQNPKKSGFRESR